MLKKQTQRTLALYFSVMTLLHGFLGWKARHDIATGIPDFSSFYTAAKILHDGHGHQLYDLSLQEAVQRSVVPVSVDKRRAALPYNHPPFEAVVFLPLARFSYLTAYWIWFAVNIGLLMAIITRLRRNLPVLGQIPIYLWATACLSFAPIFIALLQGQDSILLLFCFCMVFAGLCRASEGWVGGWLGFGLFKFHIVFPFLVPFLILKRSALYKGFLGVALLLTLIGWKVVGWKGLLNYPRYVWALNHNTKLFPLVTSEGTASLYGLISSLAWNQHPELGAALYLLLAAGLLAISTAIWRRAHHTDVQHRFLVIAVNLLIALLLSYHLWTHDLSLLLLPMILIVELIASKFPFHLWAKFAIWACVGILYCSPITFILLAYHKLYEMGLVLLVLLSVLLAEIFGSRDIGVARLSKV